VEIQVGPEIAIQTEHLTKVFRVPLERTTSLRQLAQRGFRSAGYRRFEALHDISIEVKRGEFFSVIGPNGSGKSTLLKIIAGIYRVTSGRVAVEGRLSPFIELGVGFNAELTARENIYLTGAILGLSRSRINEQFDEIVQFAELSEFIDQKLKNYSSGMLVRLAFAVAIQAHADILVVDEVLAVGDAGFQEKCFDVFRRFKAEGRTIVFVSHDMGSVQEFSDRVLLLSHGRAIGTFSPAAAAVEYSRLQEEHANSLMAGEPGASKAEVDRPHIAAIQMLDAEGKPTHAIQRGAKVTVKLKIANPRREALNAGVAIYRDDGLYCFGTNTVIAHASIPNEAEIVLNLDYECMDVQHGTYWLTAGLFGARLGTVHEMRERLYSFHVGQSDGFEGVLYLHHKWRAG
jgi:ABC-type polysaccharide/polyol phosphate transport system ATPase subunit